MRSPTYRFIRAAVLIGFLLLAARSAFAQTDQHQFDTAALSHCQSSLAACLDQVPSLSGDLICEHSTGFYGTCASGDPTIARFAMFRPSTQTFISDSQCSGIIEKHAFCEIATVCESGLTINSASWFQTSDPSNLCDGSCGWEQCGGVSVCGGGSCVGPICSTGQECDWSDNVENAPPAGCQYQSGTVVCDCVQNPEAWFCSPTNNQQCTTSNDGIVTCYPGNEPDPPGDEGPPGSDQNPGSDNDGGGSDDSGGIGEHEDGEGPGSATSSGDCTVEPTCTGDAEQCATLVQVWKSVCELTKLPEGTAAPWVDDPDWGRDLKAEAERVSLEGEITNPGPSGECPENPSFSVFGENVEIDLSMGCEFAAIIRVFVLIAAYLTAAFIAYRSFG